MTDLPVKKRDEAVIARIQQMRARTDEWHLFQDLCMRCLPHMKYSDVRMSAVRSDFGRDAVARDPDGRSCFVAVSFDCSLSKIEGDANRWKEDPSREPADVMVFMTWDSPQEKTISGWKKTIRATFGLELRVFHGETILATSTREDVWDETCALLGISVRRDGFKRMTPYDSEMIRGLLNVRPREILGNPLPRRELASDRDWRRNLLVFGKPGAGKTTAIYQILEKLQPDATVIVERDFREYYQVERLMTVVASTGGVIVFDDLQERPESFRMLCEALLAQPPSQIVLLTAVRSTEWSAVEQVVPPSYLEELKLVGEGRLHLGDLSEDECCSLVEMCRQQWRLDMEDRLVRQAAMVSKSADASPLDVISLLAPAKARADCKVTDQDLAEVPRDVQSLWAGYFERLGGDEKAILRPIKLFWSANTEPQHPLFESAAAQSGLQAYQVDNALELLERSLWVGRHRDLPRCLDVQLEAIPLTRAHFDRWDSFVQEFSGVRSSHLSLLNGTGAYYYQVRRAKAPGTEEYRQSLVCGLAHFEKALSISDTQEERAQFLNNASLLYSELAALETTRDKRGELLRKAVAYAEEAIGLYRQLRLHANVAASLNNASNLYSDLAALETTRDKRGELLRKAVADIDEAIELYRQVGTFRNLIRSLRNGVRHHLPLALHNHSPADSRAAKLCDEGLELALKFGDKALAEWFADARKATLGGGAAE